MLARMGQKLSVSVRNDTKKQPIQARNWSWPVTGLQAVVSLGLLGPCYQAYHYASVILFIAGSRALTDLVQETVALEVLKQVTLTSLPSIMCGGPV